MSQRESGYERKERDLYETPAWVTACVIPYLGRAKRIWEPACGSGLMAEALKSSGKEVISTDIATGTDFLLEKRYGDVDAIVTNPPYALAKEFIEHALDICDYTVAMLLRTDYDHAKTRQHLFGKNERFARKVVLTRRIIWFDGPGAAPSFNHAWYIWEDGACGEPKLSYAA